MANRELGVFRGINQAVGGRRVARKRSSKWEVERREGSFWEAGKIKA